MRTTNKLIAFWLFAVILGVVLVIPIAAFNEGVEPRLNNVDTTVSNFYIEDNNAKIYVAFYGYSAITTSVKITVTLQKRNLLVFWKDVASWTDTSTYSSDSFYYSCEVSTGTYRARIRYEISGIAGATEVVEEEIKATN